MTKETYNKIMTIARAHRLHKDRAEALKLAGFETNFAYMGSGGMGQTQRFSKLGVTRVQVGCGYGRNNRALVVEVDHD